MSLETSRRIEEGFLGRISKPKFKSKNEASAAFSCALCLKRRGYHPSVGCFVSSCFSNIPDLPASYIFGINVKQTLCPGIGATGHNL